MRILVVEDEKKVAKALREGLEAEHYDVRVAATGEEGFFLVNHEAFDCVVLDLMLPQRDGLEVLTTLRMRGLQDAGPDPHGEGHHRRPRARARQRR
jgi:two-component system copper resistance phosphate regulon response regulator CusR